jgi:16S rRNA (cytidine1402-2'-O)-methyltransferase
LNIVDPSLLRQAAAAAAGGQQYPPGCLYIVATPIGNLADLTLRAIHVLSLVDVVACEDTRVSATLMRHLGLDKPLVALHAHNEQQAAGALLERLSRGESVACISDAGTPAISDPGAALVARAAAAGHRVVPVPGASSAAAAVSVAGDTVGSGFRFVGFLPAKGAERRDALAATVAEPGSVVLFEAPHRIDALSNALAEAAPARSVTVCRELTKQFETVATMPAAALPGWLAADTNRGRGEFVVVLHAVPVPASAELSPLATRTLEVLQRELPLKQAVALAAELSGAPRNALYDAALQRRDQDALDDPGR